MVPLLKSECGMFSMSSPLQAGHEGISKQRIFSLNFINMSFVLLVFVILMLCIVNLPMLAASVNLMFSSSKSKSYV